MSKLYYSLLGTFLSSCAQLHHVQIGEIVSHPDFVQKPFDIKISETGVNQGITTQYSTSHGFFSWTNYVEMQGLCVTR